MPAALEGALLVSESGSRTTTVDRTSHEHRECVPAKPLRTGQPGNHSAGRARGARGPLWSGRTVMSRLIDLRPGTPIRVGTLYGVVLETGVDGVEVDLEYPNGTSIFPPEAFA
jgi:hypothetical protein